jgi:polyhydroxyalkanoate synthesis regulator phasin
LGDIIKNESKSFIDELGEEFKEVKKECDEKIA